MEAESVKVKGSECRSMGLYGHKAHDCSRPSKDEAEVLQDPSYLDCRVMRRATCVCEAY